MNILCGQNVQFFSFAFNLVLYIVTTWLKGLFTSKTVTKITARDLRFLCLRRRSIICRWRRLIHYLQCLHSPFTHYLQCLHILHHLHCQSQKTGKLHFVFLLHNACLQYSAPQWDELWTLYCWTTCGFYSPISTQNYAHDFRRNARSPSSDVHIILVRFLNQTWWMLRTSIKKKGSSTVSQLLDTQRGRRRGENIACSFAHFPSDSTKQIWRRPREPKSLNIFPNDCPF